MKARPLRTFLAGLLVGTGLWLPIFVAASAEGDAHGWSTLVALGLFVLAGVLAARFDRRPRVASRSSSIRIAAEPAAHAAALAPAARPTIGRSQCDRTRRRAENVVANQGFEPRTNGL